MASLYQSPRYTALDNNGKPIVGAKLYFFTAGTTTPVDVFSDNGLSNAHTQPVVSDANGLFPAIYLQPGSYKFRLLNASDVEQWVEDNVSPALPADNGTIAVANGGTGAASATAARTNLGAAAASDVTSLSTDVATVKGELDGIGGSLGSIAAKDTIAATDFDNSVEDVVIQSQLEEDSANIVVSSTTMPLDDTVPQVTEGAEIASFTFTPKRDDSRIRITYNCNARLTSGSSLNAVLALFTSNTVNAIDACPQTFSSLHYNSFTGSAEISPGSTSTLTISMRAGVDTGGITINNGFGASNKLSILVEELVNPPVS